MNFQFKVQQYQTDTAQTLMYWNIGRLIEVDVLQRECAYYARKIVASLGQQLSWTHFKTILRVKTLTAPIGVRGFSTRKLGTRTEPCWELS